METTGAYMVPVKEGFEPKGGLGQMNNKYCSCFSGTLD